MAKVADSFGERVREYFTLSDAHALSVRIPASGRSEIASALSLGRQKAEAAEALWSNGHAAEGLRLGVEALRATLEAAPTYARTVESVPAPQVRNEDDASDVGVTHEAKEAPVSVPWREVLEARGVARERVNLIADAEAKATSAALPKFDSEITAAHSDLYQLLSRARLEVDRALAYAAMSPRQLSFEKIARITVLAVLGLVLAFGVWFATRTEVAITATASSTFGNAPQFGPPNVLDGQPDTEWLLPDRESGWVDANLSPPRHISRVTLRNAKNAPHFDRATRAYRLEFYSHDRVLRTIDGEFSEFSREPVPVTHDVGLDEVDRIRFVVSSHHNLGGGLAEMTIEE